MKRIHCSFPLILILVAGLFFSCKPEKEYVYEVNEIESNQSNLDKKTLKTPEQYMSILHANLFQKALSANELIEITKCIDAVGDKEMVYETILSSFMNRPDKIIPDELEMRANLDQFIIDTYKRFLIRNPTEAEKAWFRNYIESDQNISPELVYMSFALSEEYLYY